ncbi:MAG: adenylate kinase [Clostridia bacterium]|nr:adenylate kinase [Clostridia bacterium]
MKKVIVIGCPGSGKSWFSRALHDKTGIPLYHLDLMYWRADRTTVDKVVFRERLRSTIEKEEWIIDGNYGSTMEMRMEACDTVFFLDYPVEVCLSGMEERRGKPRPDMPWVEDEVDEEFIAFIKNYNTVSRPGVLELMGKYSDKNIIIFQRRGEADAYLAKVE